MSKALLALSAVVLGLVGSALCLYSLYGIYLEGLVVFSGIVGYAIAGVIASGAVGGPVVAYTSARDLLS